MALINKSCCTESEDVAHSASDLDDEVSRGEIGSLFGNPDQNTGIVPQPRTYFKSVTIRTVRTPDGVSKTR